MKPYKDMTGQEFGQWRVLRLAEEHPRSEAHWVCQCDCGTIKSVSGNGLRRGKSTSCGCTRKENVGSKPIDISAQRFGKLVALSYFRTHGWFCECDCGGCTFAGAGHLRAEQIISCGCWVKHGHSKRGQHSGAYRSWCNMRQRCSDPNHITYPYYGGRGIKVCERWDSFISFLEDMGERPEGKSIDRIDTNGNYEPGNCRWATSAEQVANQRNKKK